MTERHRVRVVLECEVEIRDVSMAAIQARRDEWRRARIAEGWAHPDLPFETPSDADLEGLRLLQEALLAAPQSLSAWVMHEVATDLDFRGIEEAGPACRDGVLRIARL